MTLSSPICWNFARVGAVACLLSSPLSVAAQQSAPGATPAPLPSPTTSSVLQDRPKSEEAQKLAPVAPVTDRSSSRPDPNREAESTQRLQA